MFLVLTCAVSCAACIKASSGGSYSYRCSHCGIGHRQGLFLPNSGVFTVRQVTVSGVSHITAEEVTELAAIPEGTTLLSVDANGITQINFKPLGRKRKC